MSPSGPFDLHPITSPATGARGAEALPDDFAEEAAGRLRIVALVMAGLWSIGIAVNHLIFPYLDLRPEQIVPWTPVSDLVGLGSIALSAAVYCIAPRAARDLERLRYHCHRLRGGGGLRHRRRQPVAPRRPRGPALLDLRGDPAVPAARPRIHPDGAGRLVPGRVHGPGRHPHHARARRGGALARRWSRGPISRTTSAPCSR